MERETKPALERRFVYEETTLGRSVNLITPMRQRQTDGIRNLIHPLQLSECIQSTHRFRDDPRIMKRGEGTSADSNRDCIASLVNNPCQIIGLSVGVRLDSRTTIKAASSWRGLTIKRIALLPAAFAPLKKGILLRLSPLQIEEFVDTVSGFES